MSLLDQCTAWLGEPNCRAFIHVIREGETSQRDEAYRTANIGGVLDMPALDQPWPHPWYGRTTTEVGHSTAFGAPQILGTSFKEFAEAVGLGNDCRPINQDLYCAWAIGIKRRAMAEVLDGDLARAIAKLKDEWISLPRLGLDRASRIFRQYGGTEGAPPGQIGPQEAPPAPDASTHTEATSTQQRGGPMGAGLIVGLVQAALSVFAPLAQQKIQAELGRHTDDATAGAVAQNVMDAIQKATGHADPIAATAAITAPDAPPAVVAAAQDDALARLDRMAPVLDKLAQWDKQTAELAIAGRDAAQVRGARDKVDIGPALTYAGVALVGITLLLLLAIMGVQMYYADDHKPDTTMIALIGPLLGVVYKVFSELYAYRFDGTPKSNAAEAALSEMSRK